MAALVAAHARSLRSVNLRENELGDRGAVTLARALVALAAPQSVDLVGNQVRACVGRTRACGRGGLCAHVQVRVQVRARWRLEARVRPRGSGVGPLQGIAPLCVGAACATRL